MEYRKYFPEPLLRTLQTYAPALPERVWDGIWISTLLLTIWWTPTSSSALVAVFKVVLPFGCFWAMLCAATCRMQAEEQVATTQLNAAITWFMIACGIVLLGSSVAISLVISFGGSPGWIGLIAAIGHTLIALVVGIALKMLIAHSILRD